MLPIRDLNPTRTTPWLTWLLIAVNVGIYVYQWMLGPMVIRLVEAYGVVPYYLVVQPDPSRWMTPLTSMFLHGTIWHLLGNMWFLYVFGDNVEDRLGKVRYLLFYVACGLGAVVAQAASDPSSKIPMIGASGAIAGVLGAYLVLYPRAKVLTLVPLLFFFFFAELSAFWFLGIWFGYQLLMGLMEEAGAMGGVAFWAHVGGFVVGVLLILVLRPKEGPRGPRRGAITPEWRRPVRRG